MGSSTGPEGFAAEEDDEEDDFVEEAEGLKCRVGMLNVAVELTRSGGSGCTPSLSPSSSSRLSGARVHAAPLLVVRFVVVVPTMPQPVKVALYSSEQVEELVETDAEVGAKSVQVLKTSVTVVF